MNEELVIFTRSVISFFSLLIFTRVLGKQHISQLSFFDYVSGLAFGSIAASISIETTHRALSYWIALLTWALLSYVLQFISMKWRYAAKYLEGEPVIIIMNGKIMEKALRKIKYRVSDITELLRNKDVFDLTEIDFAILEPNGQLSILKKPEYQNPTIKDMNMQKAPSGISSEIIYDGRLIEENLLQLNRDKNWLMSMLHQQGISDVSEVFLATLNPSGTLYVDLYSDHMSKITDIGDYKGPY